MGGKVEVHPPPVSSPTRGEDVRKGVPYRLVLIPALMPIKGEGSCEQATRMK